MTKPKNDQQLDREFEAMRTMIEALDPMPQAKRARVLGAVMLLVAPNALTDQQWLSLIRNAQREDAEAAAS